MKWRDFGYGMSAKLPLTPAPIAPLPPEVDVFRKKIFRAYKVFIGFSSLLALLLPSDLRGASSVIAAWVDLVQHVIPYVRWIEQNSKIPNLAAVWFAIVWPLIFAFHLYVVVQLPYRHARTMLRAGGLSIWRHLQVLFGLLMVSWMGYAVWFERTVATNKSVTNGHARLIEATIIDSRFGLALLSPWLISLCLVIWVSTLVVVLLHVARFFCVDVMNKEGNLK